MGLKDDDLKWEEVKTEPYYTYSRRSYVVIVASIIKNKADKGETT